MRAIKEALALLLFLTSINSFSQNIIVDGVSLINSGAPASSCINNGYQLKGTANSSGGCVSLTQNTFDAGALWVCDPINLNQSFKVYFEANFDAFNSGDGIAFVLQTAGVPDILGGEGGGIGYTYGNLTNCIPVGSCNIDPSVIVEFDIWNNSSDPWNISNATLGTINDAGCDHSSILVNGNQTIGGNIAGPNCLLPGNVDVTDGQFHDVCIIWDVVNLEYSVYFDSSLVIAYNGDIRTNFANPSAVNWGFTAGSGGAMQNQRVCNVDMITNPSNPSCTCITPVASYLPNPASLCSGESIDIELFSTAPGTLFDWVASDNQSVNGETTTVQTNDSIQETLTNTSNITQIVNYTVTPYVIGCGAGSDINIPVIVNPTPTISGNLTLCEGSSTTLTGSGIPNSISPWQSSDVNVATINSSGVVNAVSAGTATITYMDNNDCIITTIITIYQSPVPVITGSSTYCAGDSTTLSTALNYTNYSWSTGSSSATINATIADNPITVMVTDNNGCTGTSSVFIVNEANPLYDTTIVICEGDSALIHSNYEYAAGNYVEIFTLPFGCDSISNVLLIVEPLPTVSGGNDFTSCEGEQVTLSGLGALTYIWSPNTVIDSQPFIPTSTTTYTVTGTDINGCSDTSAITVYIEDSPNVTFTADTTTGCVPFAVTFTNTTPGALINCIWTINNGQTLIGCDSVTSIFLNPGVYDVTLETTTSNGCVGSLTYDDLVYVEDINANFTASSYELINSTQEIFFYNNSNFAVSYLWDFGDNSTWSTETNPSHVYNDSQESYVITLIAFSELGCSDTMKRTIIFREEPIYHVPNTFTPNGDEFNQYFKPVFEGDHDPYNFNLFIYNRWGELIWESYDSNQGWDGTSFDGSNSLVQDGTYAWKIVFNTISSNEKIELFGHVNVIR